MGELLRRRVVVQVDTLKVTDLDVAFRVERTLKPEPNTAEIDIYNLSPDNRRKLQELDEHAVVLLDAGYESGTSTIFRGDLKSALTVRDGTDLVTQVRAGDGARAYRTARASRSYAAGTPVESAIRGLASDMGIETGELGGLARAVIGGVRRVFEGGVSFSGRAAPQLTALTSAAGLEWSVQDGRLQVLERGRALRGRAVLLTPDTGLIDAPEIDSKGALKARTLIIPDIFPGQRVQVDSEFVTGVFRAEACRYTGDTTSDEWTIEIDGRAEEVAA